MDFYKECNIDSCHSGVQGGKTFVAFLASVRVFMAEKLMLTGKYTLQEVADQVGLYPQSTFNHTYKRLRGFSPNEFMKRVEKEFD